MKKENWLFGVFDIETNNWIDFEMLGFFDGTQYKLFTSVRRFLNFIDSRSYKGWRFYAHNGGKFDTLFLLKDIFDLGWKVRIIERGGRVIALYCTTRKTNFVILDSFALLPQSLKSLGIAFDVEHKKIDLDVSKGTSRYSERDKKYLENDCYCTFEVLSAFFSSAYIAHPQITIASQSLDTFRSLFLEGDLRRMKLEDEIFFRNHWYSGGRVEVYKGKGENLYSYDINSLYPYAMQQEMPCGDMIETRSYQEGRIGFYNVWLKALPEFYISPLLIKRRNGSSYSNYYVNGPGEYFLSSNTLEVLRKDFGVQYQVLSGYYFKERKAILQDFVKTFYKLKSENKGNALYIISKLMLNSLYGKFSQTRWKQSVESWSPELKDYIAFDNDFGLVLVEKQSRSKFILPYLGAYITDLARLYHWELMQQHEKKIFYCDTDSLFSSVPFSSRVGTEIGELSFLGKWNGVFLAPKSYALKNGRETKIVFKGFSAEEFRFLDFERALRNRTPLEMEKERILSYRECLYRKGEILRERSPFLKMVKTKKRATLTYDRREVIPSMKFGFETRPFEWFPE